MTAVELFERERELVSFGSSEPAKGQIAAIPLGSEQQFVLNPSMIRVLGEVVLPRFDVVFPLDSAPSTTLIVHDGKVQRVMITHRSEENDGIEWLTRTIQPIPSHRDATHTVLARSVIAPLSGAFAGTLLGEVHKRPDSLGGIHPRTVRPFYVDDLAWYQSLAKNINPTE